MSQRDKSFKDEAVRLALTSSQPYSKTARDLGVKESTLYHWIKVSKNKAPIITDETGSRQIWLKN